MRILNNLYQNYNKPSFKSKIDPITVLEAVRGDLYNFTVLDNVPRINALARITEIPKERIIEKTQNQTNLKSFMSAIGAVIKNRYPQYEKASEQFEKRLARRLEKNGEITLIDLFDCTEAFAKKFNYSADINFNEGEKKFFNNFLDKCI